MMFLLPVMAVALAAEPPAPCTPVAPEQVALVLPDLIGESRYADIQERVVQMEAGFPCLSAYATSDALVMVYQGAGTAAFHTHDLQLASDLFRRAVLVDPNRAFDVKHLDSAPLELYTSVQQAVGTLPEGLLVTVGPVVVDGTAYRSGGTTPVAVGNHLVQYVEDEDRIRSLVLPVEAGERYRIGVPDPERLAAQQQLVQRRRKTSFWTAAGLTVLSGGFYALAVVQEASLDDRAADEVADPYTHLRNTSLKSNLALSGSLVSLAGGIGFGVYGLRAEKELEP